MSPWSGMAESIDHVDPFQDSASVPDDVEAPCPTLYEPTAKHLFAVTHDTPDK